MRSAGVNYRLRGAIMRKEIVHLTIYQTQKIKKSKNQKLIDYLNSKKLFPFVTCQYYLNIKIVKIVI
jgi:hypothetical protein